MLLFRMALRLCRCLTQIFLRVVVVLRRRSPSRRQQLILQVLRVLSVLEVRGLIAVLASILPRVLYRGLR